MCLRVCVKNKEMVFHSSVKTGLSHFEKRLTINFSIGIYIDIMLNNGVWHIVLSANTSKVRDQMPISASIVFVCVHTFSDVFAFVFDRHLVSQNMRDTFVGNLYLSCGREIVSGTCIPCIVWRF
jgi:hypothetical protein